MSQPQRLRFIDIGSNLLDGMFHGVYRGVRKHDSDVAEVMGRAAKAGVEGIMVTAGSLTEAREALQLCRDHAEEAKKNNNTAIGGAHVVLRTTVGIHPTKATLFEERNELLAELLQVAVQGKEEGHVVAIGECGLDYERLQFASKEVQHRHFEKHFALTEATGLPMFLHCRAAGLDLADILRANRSRFTQGVVHSFDGTKEELDAFLELGMYIGINGCSLRTEENLRVAAQIPLERLMLETDAPWCSMKPSHASYKHVQTTWQATKKPKKHVPGADMMVKDRCEPAMICQVLEVLAAVRGESKEDIMRQVFCNTNSVFRVL